MPEQIRAIIFLIPVLAFGIYIASKFSENFVETKTFRLWVFWFTSITILCFTIPYFWIFLSILFLLVFFYSRRDPLRVSLFFVLLCAIPPVAHTIPGIFGLNVLFEINSVLVISFIVLLPLLKQALRNRENRQKFTAADKIALSFFALLFVLNFRETSFTDGLRQNFILFFKTILPYLIFSRIPNDIDEIKKLTLAIIIPIIILSLIAIFESAKVWQLYASINRAWGGNELVVYMKRGGILRAVGPLLQPIELGFYIAVTFCLTLGFKLARSNQVSRWAAQFLLLIALLATVSRGPWIGCAVGSVLFWINLTQSRASLLLSFSGLMIAAYALTWTSLGAWITGLLPFIGDVGDETVSYREALIQNSLIIIERYFWFGSESFRTEPEMLELIQGQGIVDVVNTYLSISMEKGVIAALLFASLFVVVLSYLYKTMQILPSEDTSIRPLVCAYFSAVACVATIIFTVSSVNQIPVFYWSLLGLSVALSRMASTSPVTQNLADKKEDK